MALPSSIVVVVTVVPAVDVLVVVMEVEAEG
jgi:hypothetical protein